MTTNKKHSLKKFLIIAATGMFLNAHAIKASENNTQPMIEVSNDPAVTKNLYSNVTSLGTPSDVSGLYSDIVTLGNTGDISNLNNRLNTLNTQVTTLGTSALATLAQAVDILAAVETNIPDDITSATDAGSYLGGAVAAVQTSVNDLPTNTEFNDAVALLATSVQAGNILTAIDAVPTNAELTTALNTQTSALQGADDVDMTVLQADIVGLGTAGDISNIYTCFTNLNTAVADVPTNTELGTALDSQTLALQGATNTNTLTAIAGSGFNTTTDSLEAISNNLISVPFATAANLATAQSAITTLGTTALATSLQAGNILTAIDAVPTNAELTTALNAQTSALQGATNTNTLTAIAGSSFTSANSLVNLATHTDATNIQGTYFATNTNSLDAISGNFNYGSPNFDPETNSLAAISALLVAIQKQNALTQVMSAGNADVLKYPVTASSGAAAYNTAINAALVQLNSVISVQNNAQVLSLVNLCNLALTAKAGLVDVTSIYPAIQIETSLQEFYNAAVVLAAFYP